PTSKSVSTASGPAGFTAASHPARASPAPLMFTGFQWGGQLMLTTLVENYPGFVDGIDGPPRMEHLKSQAKRFGAEIVGDDVTELDLGRRPFRVTAGDTTVEALTGILATG